MLNPRFFQAFCTAMLLMAFQLPTQAASASIELKSTAEREITVEKNGKQETHRIPVDKAVPGDEIIYTTTFKNMLNKPAGDIAITNPVPNDSLYKGDSATGKNMVIIFSVDGGQTYAAPDKLIVKGADGKMRPALAADYTHLRWTYQGMLGAGKSGEVNFRAVIK